MTIVRRQDHQARKRHRPKEETEFLNAIQALDDREFEELIGEALSEVCGRRFFCSRSGSQHGGDGSARGPFDTVFEAKLYRNTTPLNQRNILGGFVEATQRYDRPDLWILAVSRPVSEQLERTLRREADAKAVGLLILDSPTGGESALVQLVAIAERTAIAFFPDHLEVLERLRRARGFEDRAENLRERLSGPAMTLASLRDSVDAWWQDTLRAPEQASIRLRVRLPPNSSGDPWSSLVQREIFRTHGTSIASGLSSGAPCFFVGDEGTGKTLAAIRWIHDNANGQLIIPITRAVAVVTDPALLISHALSVMLGGPSELWKGRVDLLLEHIATGGPVVTLLLDGLNERRASDWNGLLLNLQDHRYSGLVQVLATCRPYAYEHEFREFRSLPRKPFVIPVGLFSDAELNQGLRNHNIPRVGIASDMVDLLRRPRLFDLAVSYRRELEAAGEFTPARLFWEDWKDRLARHRDILGEADFREALRHIAGRIDAHAPAPSRLATIALRESIQNADPFADNAERIWQTLTELVDGGLAQMIGPETRLSLPFTALALGWDLRRRVLELPISPVGALGEQIRQWIEPWGGASFDSEVLRMAAWACVLTPTPQEVQSAIFLLWLDRPNLPPEHEDDLRAVVQRLATATVDVAEETWFGDDREAAQRLVALLAPLIAGHSREVLIERARKWIGQTALLEWPYIGRSDDPEKLRSERLERLTRRFGYDPPLGQPIDVLGETLWISAGDAPDGARAFTHALDVLIPGGRHDLLPLIRSWAVAEVVRYGESGGSHVAALLRGVGDDELSLVNEVLALAGAFNAMDDTASAHAATALGWAVGTPDAIRRVASSFDRSGRTAEMRNFRSMSRRWEKPHTAREATVLLARRGDKPHVRLSRAEQWLLDPKFQIPNRLINEGVRFLQELNVAAMHQAMGSTRESLDLEHWIPVLVREQPEIWAGVTRRLVMHVLAGEVTADFVLYNLLSDLSVLTIAELSRLAEVPGDNQESANLRMAARLLLAADGDEQLVLLLDGELPHGLYLDLAILLRSLSANGLDLLAARLRQGISWNRLVHALWQVARTGPSVTEALRTTLLDRLSGDGPNCLAPELEVLAGSCAADAAQVLLALDWSAATARDDDEAFWGSLVLAKSGLPFAEVIGRIHPRHLMRMAEGDPDGPNIVVATLIAKIEAVEGDETRLRRAPSIVALSDDDGRLEARSVALAHGLEAAKLTAVEQFKVGIDTDLRKKVFREAIEAVRKTDEALRAKGRRRTDWSFSTQRLRALWSAKPDAFAPFANLLQEFSDIGLRSLCAHEPALINSLIAVGLELEAEKYVPIWRRLRTQETSIVYRTDHGAKWQTVMPFTAKGENAWPLQIEAFDRCAADDELLDCVLHAEAAGLTGRVDKWTLAELNSSAIWRQGRAIVVRGFLGLSSPLVEDVHHLDTGASWLGSVWRRADEWRKRREISTHWIDQFASSNDLLTAAANLELMKLSADRRTWLLLTRVSLGEAARTVLTRQRNRLKIAIEKREKDMSERFLGEKLIEGVWPRDRFTNSMPGDKARIVDSSVFETINLSDGNSPFSAGTA